MPSITIRDVPESTLEALRAMAKKNHRSLQGELMHLFEQAIITKRHGVSLDYRPSTAIIRRRT
jgi:plasmid stability protein